MRFNLSYLVVLESISESLSCLISGRRPVGKASGDTVPASLRCLRARFAEWHGDLCGQLSPPKFVGWDGKSCH
jgi:hypothetical protein